MSNFSIYYKNGIYYERIVPKEFVGMPISIEFSSFDSEDIGGTKAKIYRYSFKNEDFES